MLVESTLADQKDRRARLDQPENGLCTGYALLLQFLGSET